MFCLNFMVSAAPSCVRNSMSLFIASFTAWITVARSSSVGGSGSLCSITSGKRSSIVMESAGWGMFSFSQAESICRWYACRFVSFIRFGVVVLFVSAQSMRSILPRSRVCPMSARMSISMSLYGVAMRVERSRALLLSDFISTCMFFPLVWASAFP